MYFDILFMQMSIDTIISAYFDNAVDLSAKSYCQEKHFIQSKGEKTQHNKTKTSCTHMPPHTHTPHHVSIDTAAFVLFLSTSIYLFIYNAAFLREGSE